MPRGGSTSRNTPVRKLSQLVSTSRLRWLSQRTSPPAADNVSVIVSTKSTSGQGRSSKPSMRVTILFGASKSTPKAVR